MNEALPLGAMVLGLHDWFSLFLHYLSLSLLSIGGAITTAPDMHRFLVAEQHWLTDAQFTASLAIAQSAPGPNVLFVALLGWNVGMNAGEALTGLLGVFLTMLGILIPSTTLTYAAAQWGQRNRQRRTVRAFKQGMAPVVVALLLATSWILAASSSIPASTTSSYWVDNAPLWLLTALVAVVVWRTRLHLLWLLTVGAVLGWHGLV